MNVVNFVVVKADNRVFIAHESVIDPKRSQGWGNDVPRFVFDGNEAEKTYHPRWFELSQVPQKVERKIPERKANVRYERIPEFSSVGRLPEVIPSAEWDCDNEYRGFEAMFEEKWDVVPAHLEEVEFAFSFFDENVAFMPPPETDIRIKTALLAQLIVPPVYQHMHECRLPSPDFYKAIREYVKEHIDGRYAEVTSDYDFCFTVKKKLSYYTPKPYEVDLNATKKTHKVKMVTRYQEHVSVPVFEMTDTNHRYKGYSVLPDFVAGSHEELIVKLKEFLEELINDINTPIVVCRACNGTGTEQLEKNQTVEAWKKSGHIVKE